jgi:hypothetical protein
MMKSEITVSKRASLSSQKPAIGRIANRFDPVCIIAPFSVDLDPHFTQ